MSLVEYINKMNAKNKADGLIGTLTNDPDHWAGYGVFTVEQFLDYLDREHQHNMEKSDREEYQEVDEDQEWQDFGEMYDDSFGDYI
tara:strand:+ start:383 stop:640 length:258 start_codon:yes stop_codon:yes gene_type:complete